MSIIVKSHFRIITETGVPGTWSMVGTNPDWPCPIALVWFRYALNSKHLEIMNSFVVPSLRREGFRTKLQLEMFKTFTDVTRINTQSGSDTGKAWMESVGYKQTKNGLWGVSRTHFMLSEKVKGLVENDR